MDEWLVPLAFWLSMLVPPAVFIRQFRQVRKGVRGKGKAIVLGGSYALLPALAGVFTFVVLVGYEELTGSAMIGEGFARALPLLLLVSVAEALVLTLVFVLVLVFTRTVKEKRSGV